MSDLSINVMIAGVSYPLTVKPEEEEEVRKAVKMINDNVTNIMSTFAVKDKQTPLAMTALQYTTQLVKETKGVKMEGEQMEKIKLATEKLSSYLKNV